MKIMQTFSIMHLIVCVYIYIYIYALEIEYYTFIFNIVYYYASFGVKYLSKNTRDLLNFSHSVGDI